MCETTPFGTLEGQDIPLIRLRKGDIQVELLPFGAAIRSITVPDRQGRATDVCLGYDRVEDYRDRNGCLGGTIGRNKQERVSIIFLGGLIMTMIGALGLMPFLPDYPVVEVYPGVPCPAYATKGRFVIHSSDAHRLEDLQERTFSLDTQPTARDVMRLLRALDGRQIPQNGI